jgi:hypothetical protein
VTYIQDLPSRAERIRAIVEKCGYVIRKNRKILDALTSNKQSHVVNYIRDPTQCCTTEDWPVYLSSYKAKICGNLRRLKNAIHCHCGLLEAVFEKEYISLAHKHYIEAGKTDEEMNGRLLRILLRQSVKVYLLFVKCLQETKQLPVASLLAPDIVGLVPPTISDEQWSRISSNWKSLVELIDTTCGLLEELRAVNCLTKRQTDFIRHQPDSETERNTRLMEVARRMSASDFSTFIQCFNKSGQAHIALVLSTDGSLAHLVAKFNDLQDFYEMEKLTVRRFMELMRLSDAERREQCGEQLCQVLEKLRGEMCELIAVRQQTSIGLYFFCSSLSGLQFLRDLYASSQLKRIVNEIFVALSHKSHAASLQAENIEWDEENYRRCVKYLHSVQIKNSNNYLTQASNDNRPENISKSIPVDQLPFELIEVILMKSIGQFFVGIYTMTLDAEVHSAATFWSVSKLWWLTFKYHKSNKKRLKYYIYRTLMSNVRADLLNIINVEDSFLDKLLDGGVVTAQQIVEFSEVREDEIKTKSAARLGRLLDHIIKLQCVKQVRQFFTALRETGQKHVVNYIRVNGRRSRNKRQDNWPLFYTEASMIIEENWLKLVEFIESHDAMLNALQSHNIFSERLVSSIQSREGRGLRNMILLHVLQRGSVATYKKFIDCLKQTKQDEIVSLLVPTAVTDDPVNEAILSDIPDSSEEAKAQIRSPVVDEDQWNLEVDSDNTYFKTGVRIKNLRSDLLRMIDIEYGLLDELVRLDVLTPLQVEVIQSKSFDDQRTEQLLDYVVNSTHHQRNQFLEALNRTDQSHVVAYIQGNGIYAAENGDNWPLYASSKRRWLDRNRRRVIELLGLKCGLLDELLSVDCVNWRQVEAMKYERDKMNRNNELVRIFLRKSIRHFNQLLECLMWTKQHAVVSLLAPDMPNIQRPLDDVSKSQLIKKRAVLVKIIDLSYGLLYELYAADCVTWRQLKFIESAPSAAERNHRLLNVLRRGSEVDFQKFIGCLRRTGKEHVASVLSGDEPVMAQTVDLRDIKFTRDDPRRNQSAQPRDDRLVFSLLAAHWRDDQLQRSLRMDTTGNRSAQLRK